MRAVRTSRQAKRDSAEVKAARAATLLDNAELRAKFDEVRTQYISDIETCRLDGSEKATQGALELIRKLQALQEVKRAIVRPLAAEQIKNVNNRGLN